MHPFVWLLRKECRELLVSRSWWLLLFLMGPLTGMPYLSALRAYAEMSKQGGTVADAGEVLSPLTGVWAPAFSGCELAGVFLLPFVAIRIIGADRLSGAAKLELQRRSSPVSRIAAKALVALGGWLIAMAPAGCALALWKYYGGLLHWPEVGSLFTGHILNAGLMIAVAAAAASVTEHPSTAAVMTLGVTVGTWIVNFFAALQGGLWERAAAFTPAAVVGDFQRGLFRMDSTLVALVLVLTGLGLASIWQFTGVRRLVNLARSAALIVTAVAAIGGASRVRLDWDVSQNRANSFPLADELALLRIRQPLRIVARLAPEDPRRADLERNAFAKLRRTVPDVEIAYLASTSTGLFEQAAEGYGEIQYDMNGRLLLSRATSVDGVLEAVYAVSGTEAAKNVQEVVFRGRPLVIDPAGGSTIFYVLIPGFTLLCGVLAHRHFTWLPK
ncbi:MAG: hypothetical protein JST93_08740 [Acidobacteria bacterium]|nr:hypothetical protein [Acidobacteriota bacterium]